MNGGSFKLTKIFGIDVEINFSWILIFILFSFTLAQQYFPQMIEDLDSSVYWSMGIITTLLIFFSVLLHELAHSLRAIKEGIPIKKITLFIFGGVAQMEKEPEKAKAELRIALIGPAMSIALAFLFWLLYQFLPPELPLAQMIWFLARLNLIVGTVNLIPAFPLDGGRVLRAALWHFLNNMLRATRFAVLVGSIFAFFAIGIGFLMIFQYAWIWGLWYIFLGWMLYQAGQASYNQLIFQQALKGVLVKEIMSPNVHTVPPQLTLNELVEQFFLHKFGAFPVTEDGILKGLVTFHQIREIPRERWGYTTVSQIMVPAEQVKKVSPNDEAVEVMMKMAQENIGRVIVIEKQQIVGILSRTDMMKLINMHMMLGTEK